MTLSNTATPRYFAQFRERVLLGHIPVNREIAAEMYRIEQLIANPDIYYDDMAIEGWIKYCESELTLTDGSDLYLLDTFKLWAEQIVGWYYFVERTVWQPFSKAQVEVLQNGEESTENEVRLHNVPQGRYVRKLIKMRLTKKQYLIVARGAAKSMYAYCWHAFMLNIDTSTTHQITTAPTMKQAEEVMSPFRTAITRARGPLFKWLTEGSLYNTTGSRANRVKLASTKKGIENFLTGSLLEIRPMTINKLQGLRPKLSTVDEWLSGDLREDVVGAIEQGASKMEDYLIIAISSEGTVRNGSGDTIKMELADILKGEYDAPHISIWHYKLDDLVEVDQPEMWLKAQPNLGQTVTYDVYHLDVERALKAPAARNDILAKRFGIPMEGYTYFFTWEETQPHTPYRQRRFYGMPCALGADLSQGDDFCAFTFLFPNIRPGLDEWGVKTRSYITRYTLDKIQPGMRVKYNEFISEGSLVIFEGNVLDMMMVYEDLENHIIECGYDVRCLGYDPYNSKEFVGRWEAENGPFGVEKVIQGAKTESVPLGELKIFAEKRRLIFDEKLMVFAMGNAVTLEDTNGNRKLMKKRADEKIDNVSALMDAYVAYKANKEVFE